MNKNHATYTPPKKSKRTTSEFLRDVSLFVVGILSLPFAYTGRMLMFALAIVYNCSREGWILGKKIK